MPIDAMTIYGPGVIMHDDNRNCGIMGDTLLMTDFATFEILGGFFDYYATNYARTLVYMGDDVHSMLARYVTERGITVNSRLGDLIDFSILRDNTNYMFNEQGLMPEYTWQDLIARKTEWWNERFN
jgi:hypothetical protein